MHHRERELNPGLFYTLVFETGFERFKLCVECGGSGLKERRKGYERRMGEGGGGFKSGRRGRVGMEVVERGR